ncbi:MAG: class I SAM-dependent methyltransferase, partial [Candidatus Zixiibacteriota bacterium]
CAILKFWQKPIFSNLEELVDFSLTGLGGLITPLQIRKEFIAFLELIQQIKPQTLLEIGTARGGTLFSFTRVVSSGAFIISLDLPGGRYGGGYYWWKIPIFRSFALRGQKLHLIRADSHKQSSLRLIQEKIGDRPLDFLFIDGDHSYEGVKQDFKMYGPLVRKGGIIAFHDIVPNTEDKSCGVDRFWSEIKSLYEHTEIVDSWQQKGAGIGVIYKR